MNDLASFPVARKWPARFPERLQLYSLPTPNGVKVSVMLEETGLPYEAHLVSFEANDQNSPEFRALNPYGKIPGGSRPQNPPRRYETVQWLMFQMGGVGPMFGQVGFFHRFAGREYEDKRPRDRYVGEARRLLAVLDARLTARTWMMGDAYTIADMAIFPWVRNLVGFYEAAELVGFGDFPNVAVALARFVARPAVVRGLAIPARG